MRNEILQGDVLEVARTLADESVHCICCSPSYYGLRDYGTATWQGGREDCDHVAPPLGGMGKETLVGTTANENKTRFQQYRTQCAKCGAIRIDKQIGLEETPELYVTKMVEVFRELRRVLHRRGVCFVNLGDTYIDKQLQGIPWRVALGLQGDGWVLRNDVIWKKSNPMPESCQDRFTKAHEYIFMLSKSKGYWFDQDAVREGYSRLWDKNTIGKNNMAVTGISGSNMLGRKTIPNCGIVNTLPNPQGRNRRTVWSAPPTLDPLLQHILTKLQSDNPDKLREYLADYGDGASKGGDVFEVSTKPFQGSHFAVFPPKLIEPCILAGCPARVCVECGEAWVRVVEREDYQQRGDYRKHAGDSGHNNPTGKTPGSNTRGMPHRQVLNDTFKPTCTCNAHHKPGIVLDPFFGSGTTAHVAIQHGRDWLGIELNPDYIELAKDRIYSTQPALFAT